MEERRVFTEEEAAEVFRRAVFLSKGEEQTASITLDELRNIAAEAGLPASAIDTALKHQDRRASTVVRSVIGTLDADDLDVALESVSFATGEHAPKRVGRTLTAVAYLNFHTMRLSISAREDHTLIAVEPHLEVDWFQALAATFLVGVTGTLIGDQMFGLDKPEGLVPLWLIVLLSFFVGSGMYRARDGRMAAEALANRVATNISEFIGRRQT